MRRVITIFFALSLIAILTISSSAQTFSNDIPYRPMLNYTFMADNYYSNVPVLSGNGTATSMVFGGDDDLQGVSVVAQNWLTVNHDNYVQGTCDIYYDFMDAYVNNEPYRPAAFSMQYTPFTIKFGDVFTFDDLQLYSLPLIDNIGLNYSWYGGSAAADVTISFNMRVYWVEQRTIDVMHNVIEYTSYSRNYSVDYQGVLTGGLSSQNIPVSDVFIYDSYNDEHISASDMYEDIITSTSIMRGEQGNTVQEMFVDIESLDVSIYAQSAPFSGLIQHNSPYIDVEGYNDINDLYSGLNQGYYRYRQQLLGDYQAVMAANTLNKGIIRSIDFEGDSDNPIIRVPAMFLRAVSSFFAIDFFGLGFTLGNVIGVFVMALMVIMFLRLFAGG